MKCYLYYYNIILFQNTRSGEFTFCMQISAMMESGMVRLNARVPIRDDVRKQPLRTETSVTRY